ncbi:hypothetical protein CFOL_v3_30237 [Cephalotus follicularis]|uniref:Uncharacterized protein n=1 Tax=Cephalotus follicularis TaxID=3775 RepID=A0A1Q3D323_CEPFO|nr:hypothetical protein CFOL_v3_30237 [Cephalotus follicularis]
MGGAGESGNSGSNKVLYEIINSNDKRFGSLLKVKDSQNSHHGMVPVGVNTVTQNGNHTGCSSGNIVTRNEEVGFTHTVPASATLESTDDTVEGFKQKTFKYLLSTFSRFLLLILSSHEK